MPFFYDRKINYFEQQYSFVSKILTNEITLKAYSDGKMLSPTIDAIKEFHAQFSSNNRSYWKTRAENFRKQQVEQSRFNQKFFT